MNPTDAEPQAQTQEQPQSKMNIDEVAEKSKNMELAQLLDKVLDETTKKSLISQEVGRREFDQQWREARVYAEAGVFADAPTAFKAMAKIRIGHSWGLSEADSMKHVYFVGGKPACENEPVAAKLINAGWSWEPQFLGTPANCTGCRLWILKDGKPFMKANRQPNGAVVMVNGEPEMIQVSVEFTEEQAKAIKIYEKGQQISLLEKGQWKSGWRQNMYYWRAISQFKRFYAPGIMGGGVMAVEVPEVQIEDVIQETGSREAAKEAGRKKLEGMGAKVTEIKTPAPETKPEPKQEAPQTPQQADTDPVPEKSTEELTVYQQSVYQFTESLGPDDYWKILGNHGVDHIDGVTEANWKQIASDMSARLDDLKYPDGKPEPPKVEPAAKTEPPSGEKLQFGRRPRR